MKFLLFFVFFFKFCGVLGFRYESLFSTSARSGLSFLDEKQSLKLHAGKWESSTINSFAAKRPG